MRGKAKPYLGRLADYSRKGRKGREGGGRGFLIFDVLFLIEEKILTSRGCGPDAGRGRYGVETQTRPGLGEKNKSVMIL